jgi:hypothetical protein
MYRQFNIQQFYVLSAQCIYVFCVDLRTNNNYFYIYDMSGIDEVMLEVDKYDYEEDAELVAWLKDKLVVSEVGEVAQRLADY